jgi:8-oxo-dGTP diphosphatase
MQPRRVNVRGIIFKDGKILGQKFILQDGQASDYWGTPGGGLDPQESLNDGLHREMIEETGIAPKIGKLLFIQQFHDGKKEQLEFFFHIENPEDYHTIDLTATTHGVQEIAHVEFIDPSAEHLLPAFLQTTNIQDYIDNDRSVLITNELARPE